MLKDRQEILVLGELVLFFAAWGLGLAAAVDDYRVRTNANAGNNVAANSYSPGSYSPDSYSPGGGSSGSPGGGSSGTRFIDRFHHGHFE